MSSRHRCSRSVFACAALALAAPALAENLHFTYLWHLEQPIYWPERQASGADRYERAWQSILRTDGGAAHPENDLRDIFGKADRVAAYQSRPRDSIDAIRWAPEAGAQVSYSGGLIENIMSLGGAGQLGYAANWYSGFREARNWTTSGGKPRLDIVLFPHHHPLLPLCDDSTVRKEIQLYRAIYDDAWGATPAPSRGLFPSEMAFSERLIPILAEEGVDWVIVSNEHISRACENFPLVLGSGGVNCEPPNAADVRNPAQANWYRVNISRGCAPANAYPFSYTPHRARYIDPDSGVSSEVIVVPAAQAISWEDGYNPIGLGHFNTLNTANPANRPMLVMLAHDGDNAWGGGFSYYLEATPNLVANASGAGYVASTVEQYLANHPVPANDVVHVEDGAWVNADGDFGSPTFLNWNWPLSNNGQVDIPNGWAEDERNWAVITAAQNRVDTAEQIAGPVNIERVLNPTAAATPTERAWHYFLGALNSGYMYYGTSLDFEVKPSIACNRAMEFADAVIGDGALDQTPPTVFIPQRYPYNPGSLNFGPSHGYQQVVDDGDFWIWTFAYDVSGISTVTLKYRVDADQSVADENMTYAGGAGVGAWQALPMTQRVFPKGNFFNDPSINFFVLPIYIADQYHVEVTGLRETLIDYYVEAVDARGFVKRSPIQHVYIGDGSGAPGGGGERVVWTPAPAQAGESLLLKYDPSGGSLASAPAVFAHVGFDGWSSVIAPDPAMIWNAGAGVWELTISVPLTAEQVDAAFNNGGGVWDNNSGADWHVSVEGASGPDFVIDGALDANVPLVAANGGSELYADVRNGVLYVAATDAGEGRDHFIFVARAPGTLRAAPWAKSGQVADWDAFLADENDNDFEGWFDAPVGAAAQAATGANGGVVEGVFSLVGAFGATPDEVWLAFGPYATADGGALSPGRQAPVSLDSDAHIQAGEFVRLALDAPLIGDVDGDGCVTLSDLAGLLSAFGACAGDASFNAGADFDDDDCVTLGDLSGLLGNFGAGDCP